MELKTTDTQQLLADYVRNGSEKAFRELTARYVDFVYSTAVRLVRGDTHLAKDVAQTVFVDLARMAGRLSGDVMLGGWLHRHTCFVAANTLRSESRRLERERQAMEMNSLRNPPDAGMAELAPVLDEAINQLGAQDRLAILLRFFEQRDFRSMGATLEISEDAARMRVNRALEKLQALLKERGVTSSSTSLGNSLTTQLLIAAPAGLAGVLAAKALGMAAVAGTGGAQAAPLIRYLFSSKLRIGFVSLVTAALVATGFHAYFAHSRPLEDERAAATAPAVANSDGQAGSSRTNLPDTLQRALQIRNAPPVVMAQVGAPANPQTPDRTGALAVFSSLTGRTILHGPLPAGLPDSLVSEMASDTNNAVEILRREISAQGFNVFLDGEKFVEIVPASGDPGKPRVTAPAHNPQIPGGGDSGTNMMDLQSIDLDTFLGMYCDLTGRTILQAPTIGRPLIQLRTAGPLTRNETIYAMTVVLYLNGITAVADGEKFVQLVSNGEAGTVQARAPQAKPGEELIYPDTVRGLLDSIAGGSGTAGSQFAGKPVTLDQLIILYGNQANKTPRNSPPSGQQRVSFEVHSPVSNAELLYAIDTVLNLHGMALVPVNDGGFVIENRPIRSGSNSRSNSPSSHTPAKN